MTRSQPKLSRQQLSELETAYRQTMYEVFVNAQIIAIRVDCHSLDLNQLLQNHQQTTWTLITAYNPYSQTLSAAENEGRNNALEEEIIQLGLPYLEAVGRDPLDEWLPEKSLFVMGVSRQGAIAIGKKFNQNAILYGSLIVPPQLIWLLD